MVLIGWLHVKMARLVPHPAHLGQSHTSSLAAEAAEPAAKAEADTRAEAVTGANAELRADRQMPTSKRAAWHHDQDYLKQWPTVRLLNLILTIAELKGSNTEPNNLNGERTRSSPPRRMHMSFQSGNLSGMVNVHHEGSAEEEEWPEEEGGFEDSGVGDMAEKGDVKGVDIHAGFTEHVARVVFPYTDKFSTGDASQDGKPARHTKPVRHVTILASGTVESQVKELALSGDKSQHERALCFFPFRQTMMPEQAQEHMKREPNSHFVWQREDGTYALAHCWPIKYNDAFRASFQTSTGVNPDTKVFEPPATAEMRRAMVKLFGKQAVHVPFVYATKDSTNPLPVLVGQSENIIAYLRAHPDLSFALGILKILPSGFIARIVDGNGVCSSKAFYVDSGPQSEPIILYIKQGWETMPMSKPLSLFLEDSELGKRCTLVEALAKLAPVNQTLTANISKATGQMNA